MGTANVGETNNSTVDLFASISCDEFLEHYWQQRPYVFRQALAPSRDRVDANELAGLACEDAVESRLIEGEGLRGPWRCRQGPFPDLDYDSLGPKNWTLLVQSVDQWDPSVRALLNEFRFLPRWRLEDVMASFAPRGGGVGPHFDYYDVFLLQDSGRRRWDIGERCTDETPLQSHPDLKLLEAFKRQATFDLEAGDVLYLPAGLAHWGVSQSDDCVTLSVGFRAPSDSALLSEAADLLVARHTSARRYQDTVPSLESDPFHINVAAEAAAAELVRTMDRSSFNEAIGEALGRLVTDTRHCSFAQNPISWTAEDVRAFVGQATHRVVHQPHCRMAYSERFLFVNGEAYPTDKEISRGLCHGSLVGPLNEADAHLVARLLSDDMIQLS